MRPTPGLLGLAALLAFAAAPIAGCERAAPPAPAQPFKPVAEVRQLMESVVEPNAWILWEATGTIVTADEIIERRPRDDEAWEAVRNAAVTITEAGNLLMMPPRARDDGEWIRRARALVEIGQTAWQAADARDVDRLFVAGGDMYEVCLSCHRTYGHANEHAPMR
jgi:hypothetical protein